MSKIIKWILLFFGFVLCVCLMIGAMCVIIGGQPGTTYNVTYKTVSGDPTLHDQVYEVMISEIS